MVAEHITNLPCTKHSGKRTYTLMLAIHSMETPLANGYALSLTQNWLGKWYKADGSLIEASANVNVGPDTLIRSVHTDYAAWHASWANSLSVGYEQTGYAAYSRAQWLTPAGRDQIDRLAREMALDAKIYGIPLRWLTQNEVNAIRNGNRTIKGLATHAMIDPANRTDPGGGYPYDVLLASIKAYSGTNPQSNDVTPIQEDDMPLTTEDINKLLDFPIARKGGQGGTTTLRNTAAYLDANLLNIPAGVWAETVVRGGHKISVKQELADSKTLAEKATAENVALRAALAQIAAGVTIDLEEIETAVQSAVSKALTDSVALEATVTIKKAGE